MKAVKKHILGIAMVITLLFSCKKETYPEVKTVDSNIVVKTEKILNLNANFIKSEFTIDGMTCEIGCAKLIEKNINKMNGVKLAKVDFNNKLAMVEYDETMVNHGLLANVVTKTANVYKVSEMKIVKKFSDTKKEKNE